MPPVKQKFDPAQYAVMTGTALEGRVEANTLST